ncbi:hypothetical protein OUZ56_027486 [Daphnia magna]|uniref:Uncharacterized protein n=1 Tax=Daphnia magna TaxID=35525 RepID=A0ABQ9ZPY1_9CRUS|nr:hypothetical protein OUZ56_027486 [Daphnia magna]
MGHNASTFLFPSWGSVSALKKEKMKCQISNKKVAVLPSRIFASNSSSVGSINSQPSGGGFLLLLTFGIALYAPSTVASPDRLQQKDMVRP